MPHKGQRQTNRKIEYRCLTCGHVGWTQHIAGEDLMRAIAIKRLVAQNAVVAQ